MMLGIDYTFIDFAKAKENSFNISLTIFSLDVIKGLCNMGYKNKICIITKSCDFEYAKKLLPELKIVSLENPFTNIIRILDNYPSEKELEEIAEKYKTSYSIEAVSKRYLEIYESFNS